MSLSKPAIKEQSRPVTPSVGTKTRWPTNEPEGFKSWAAMVSEPNVESGTCEVYAMNMVSSVKTRISEFLKQAPAAGGISLLGTLEQQQPLEIDGKSNVGSLSTYKENWRWPNCKMSLEHQGMYEAPGSLYWLSVRKPKWKGKELAATDLSWGQVATGRMMWNDDKFIRSSMDPRKRHYIINGATPTAIPSLADLPPAGKDGGFSELPCLCTRASIIGFYSACDDALRARDGPKLLKLHEAALSMPMRLRLAPSSEQVSVDSISYSEELFTANQLYSDSFVDFSQKAVACFKDEAAFAAMTGKQMKEFLGKLGVRFHGTPMNDNIQRALISVAPFVNDDDFRQSFKAFEDVSMSLNDQTKIAVLLNVTSKHFKSREAAVGACVQLLKALRLLLLYKDIVKASDLTKEFLVGGRHKAGFTQMFYKRLAFIQFLVNFINASPASAHVDEARTQILPVLATVHDFAQTFAKTKSALTVAVGAQRRESLIAEVLDHEDGEAGQQQLGIANATASKFDAFNKNLSQTGQMFAAMLAKVQGGAYDEEFLQIANSEASAAAFSFAWGDLFAGSLGNGKSDEKVNGVLVPMLRAACLQWIERTQAQPTGADIASSAIGGVDRTLTAALQQTASDGDHVEEEEERTKTVARLNHCLSQKMVIDNIEGGVQTAANFSKTFRELRRLSIASDSSAVGEKGKRSGSKTASGKQRQGTMFVCFAELYPGHATQHTPEMFRGVIAGITPEFKELIRWVVNAKQQLDVVIISDGRSDTARSQIRELLKTLVPDDVLELWMVYDLEASLRTDPRNVKRRLPFTAANMETLFAVMPYANKTGQRALVPRDSFRNCGESTNFCRTYTGVLGRNLAEIPRLTTDAKKKNLGAAAVGAFARERMTTEVETNGHPFLWSDFKPVPFFSGLFKDFEVADVIDLTPGSGAACVAALYASIPYHAICYNLPHKQWLQGLIQRMFVAMVLNKGFSSDADLVTSVRTYLSRAAESAKHMLPGDGSSASAVGDICTGMDDSESDE